MTYTRSSTQEGFSFIELVVVILIMGILVATVGTGFWQWVKRANKSSTVASLNAVSQALDLYHADIGSYPKGLEELYEQPKGPAGKKWQGPYLAKARMPQDGWKRDFYYKVTPGGKHPYDLFSYGPHGEEGPEEEHISVWDV